MHIFPVHISSLISHVATATLHLREKICPRKSDANLKQVIIFILLKERIIMKTIIVNIVFAALMFSAAGCSGQEPFPDDIGVVDPSKYEYTEPWKAGYMDIHQISTGRGNAAFLILPDGTTMLVDMGDLGVNTYTQEIMSSVPSASKRPAEWVAQYIRHFASPLGKDGKIDYALITHFHIDHIGAFDKLAITSEKHQYKLQGITHLADMLEIDKVIYRGWPDYSYPSSSQVNSSNSGIVNYIQFMKDRDAEGKTNQQMIVGSNQQFVLLNDRSYEFSVRNLAGNLKYWTGTGNSEADYNMSTNDENEYSLAIRISYGKFDWYTGGDIKAEGYEDAISEVAGQTDVVVCNHHAYSDAMHSGFVRNMDASAWIIPVWDYYHPQPDPLARMLTSTDGSEKLVFGAGLVESNKYRLGDNGKKIKAGHIMVRVYEGGGSFQIFVLNDKDEYYEIIDKTDVIKSR